MKVIIASDTHKDGFKISKVRDFALTNGIDTILDAGDLHGFIESYNGINLHATYWEKASCGMERLPFVNEVRAINGIIHENESTFSLEDTLVFTQHNLAGYETQISEEAWEKVKAHLEHFDGNKLAIYGHTHGFQFNRQDGITAINPGSVGIGDSGTFVVYDLETGDLELNNLDGEKLFRITSDENSDIVHIRNFSAFNGGSYFARLDNDHEIYVRGNHRSPEFKRIVNYNTKDREASGLDGLVFAIQKDNGKFVVWSNENETKEYDQIMGFSTHYGENSKPTHYFIAVQDGKKLLATEDGRETKAYDNILKRFDTNQNLKNDIYFIAQDGEEQVLVRGFDSEEILRAEKISDHSVGRIDDLFYAVVQKDKNYFIRTSDGRDSEQCGYPSNETVTKDNIVYSVKAGRNEQVLKVNEEEVDRKKLIGHGNNPFSSVSFIDDNLSYVVSTETDEDIESTFGTKKVQFQTVLFGGVDFGRQFRKESYNTGVSKIGIIEGEEVVVYQNGYNNYVTYFKSGREEQGNLLL